jgi:hypothetical protein
MSASILSIELETRLRNVMHYIESRRAPVADSPKDPHDGNRTAESNVSRRDQIPVDGTRELWFDVRTSKNSSLPGVVEYGFGSALSRAASCAGLVSCYLPPRGKFCENL